MQNKRAWFVAGLSVIALLTVGVVNAWGSKPSDVSGPASTPNSNLVRYHVVGDSMAPTIVDGDWLLARINTKSPSVGQIVIMKYPKDITKVYCRRVIAVPGDRVVMKYYSNVKITTVYSSAHPNGAVFPVAATPQGNAFGEYDASVASGMVYVVGDNTAPGGSFDSDEWGLLPDTNVVGVVIERTSPSPRAF
jgi:signal peptidase I